MYEKNLKEQKEINAFYYSKENVMQYIEIAKDYNGSDIIKKLRAYLPKGSNVLEIGSGSGNDISILSQDFNVVGTDLSPVFLEYLSSKYSDIEFRELNAITLEIDKKFDCLYSNKVLHHLRTNELALSIEQQSKILNDQGLICHSFFFGEGEEEISNIYARYYSIEEIKNLFQAKFEILTLEQYTEMEENDSILIIAKKVIDQMP